MSPFSRTYTNSLFMRSFFSFFALLYVHSYRPFCAKGALCRRHTVPQGMHVGVSEKARVYVGSSGQIRWHSSRKVSEIKRQFVSTKVPLFGGQKSTLHPHLFLRGPISYHQQSPLSISHPPLALFALMVAFLFVSYSPTFFRSVNAACAVSWRAGGIAHLSR